MATKRFVIDGFGQLELNNVAFRRDGRVEAQCALDATDFASVAAENGMLLAVDKANKKIKFATDASLPIALNYSAEHMYDDRANGLKEFKINYNSTGDYFYPRVGYLAVGDLFTTNCICYNDTEFADETALKAAFTAAATTPVYGGISPNGAILVSATKPQVGPVLRVVKPFTMPDGTYAVQFQVFAA